MLRGKDIVCISSLDWEAMWTSKQQIMHRLAETNRVLYVEEPVTMLAPLKVPALWRRWAAAVPRLRRVDAGLWTLTLPPLLPFGNMKPKVNEINQGAQAHYLNWALDRLYFDEEYIFWSYLPSSVRLLDRLGRAHVPPETPPPASPQSARRPSLVVYHCVDEHSAFPGFVSPAVVKAYDDELTRRADVVITTSDNLRLSRLPLNPYTYTVLNAADVNLFGQVLDAGTVVPEDMEGIPTPRLGVVGMLDSRLDVDALEALATADPSWHIVLVGPLKRGQVDEPRLRSHSNIHLLGEKSRAELPGYLKGMAVALIPYRPNDLTRNIFPLKLFEYLAAGIPVVAGGLPELDRFSGVIGVARALEDYPRLVQNAISLDSTDSRAIRIELAAQNSWDHRVEDISRLVEEALARAGDAPEN
jgi:glycosyltransferase involved in cell wall biosynthesis